MIAVGKPKNLQMVTRYAHLAPEHLQAAVDVLTQPPSTSGTRRGGGVRAAARLAVQKMFDGI